jgi:flagellar hook-associated protein 3 FlgL
MTRISTLTQQQSIIGQMLRSQIQIADDQRQVSTGYKTDRFEGLARDTAALVSARAIESRTTQFVELGQQIAGQVSLQDTGLSTLYDAAKNLRDSLLSSLANNSGRIIAPELDSAFVSGKSVLNTRYAGKYLYSGSRTDVQPFNAVDLADLSVIASPIAGFFDNSQQKPQVRMDTNQIVEYGVLADEMGLDFMASVKRLGEYDAATPFNVSLTPADRAMLQSELTNLDAVMSGIIKLQANNGFVEKRIESIISRHETLVTVNKQLISDISEVDMAEAITRFNQDKLAVEASYNLLRQFSQLSLLNYL